VHSATPLPEYAIVYGELGNLKAEVEQQAGQIKPIKNAAAGPSDNLPGLAGGTFVAPCVADILDLW
jgi:hypothetical protein